MPVRKDLAAVEPYVPQRPMDELAAELGLERIVKLAANEGAFGPLPAAAAAYEAALAELNRYPDGAGLALRTALAERHDVPPEQIVLGDGADELIRLAAVITLAPGDRALTPWPSFPSYLTAAACCGAEAVRVPLAGRAFDLDAVLRAAVGGERNVKLVYLANPNNPTGALLERGPVEAFLDALPAGVLCVLDEAYAEYADPEPEGIALVRAGHQRLCVLRTFSKIYGLAALRVGYAVATPAIAAALDQVRPIFNVNQPAQDAALASLADPSVIAERAAHARAAREFLFGALADAGLDPEPSQANFVYAEVPGGDGAGLADRLLRAGYAVRSLEGFGAPQAIRVTVGSDEENAGFAQALAVVRAAEK